MGTSVLIFLARKVSKTYPLQPLTVPILVDRTQFSDTNPVRFLEVPAPYPYRRGTRYGYLYKQQYPCFREWRLFHLDIYNLCKSWMTFTFCGYDRNNRSHLLLMTVFLLFFYTVENIIDLSWCLYCPRISVILSLIK